ncbi:hypothetical protein [Aquibacillus saliphilus]|uniref:hypothetical protein n=1 Tax=Aquibacillus saliphilus TaxID=1909422 RepID=UPI001CF05733|nr:hypothetical protein [Aquibacillus saliphilus]
MEEVVGVCSKCDRTIYCQDGFLDGVVDENHTLYCFVCAEGNDDKKNGSFNGI